MPTPRVSTLELRLLHSPGQRTAAFTQRESWTFDYVVDGASLLERLAPWSRGMVGRLDRDQARADRRDVQVLTGVSPPDLDANRIMLFVCSECGDLGCGAITAALTSDGTTVTWSDFKYENNYEDGRSIGGVGPFTFAAAAYRRALETAGGD